MRSGSKLFVFGNRGFRTRFWQKVSASALVVPARIWQSYKKEGSKAIKLGRRGRRTGEKRTLGKEQKAKLKRDLIDKMAERFKLAFALWARDAVKLLIKQQFGIEMPIRTVGEYLKRWGFIIPSSGCNPYPGQFGCPLTNFDFFRKL